MKVDVHGRNLPVSAPLREYVVKKMERVSRFLTPECRADVELWVERNPRIADSQTVETTIHCRGGETIRVRHSAADMYAAVDGTIDRLRRQASDHHDRRLAGRPHHPTRAAEPSVVAEGEEEPDLRAEV
jgi:putative sigma-54 modulation protein